MIESNDLDDISQAVLKMMELLHLGNTEKGALSMAGKYKSLSLCLFRGKKSTDMVEKISSVDEDESVIYVMIVWSHFMSRGGHRKVLSSVISLVFLASITTNGLFTGMKTR
jgi:hypothetical protein